MDKRFFPVLLTDWQMPLMDGIELAERVRALGMDETYIIMLTMRDGRFDYERGYGAGIDDYLTKKLPDVELHARITAAFNTAALRTWQRRARWWSACVPAMPTHSENWRIWLTGSAEPERRSDSNH